MFGSRLKVKTFLLLCVFTCLILPASILSTGFTTANSQKTTTQRTNFQKISSIVVAECKNYKYVPAEVILAMISKESGFNPKAQYTNKSGTRYLGVMQMNDKTSKKLFSRFYPKEKFDVKKLFIPEVNIKLGIWHFNNTLARYKNNVEMALTAYNKGDGGYKKYVASRGTYISSYSRSIMILSRRYKLAK
jgi:soluble lytic murein transglycosylase-like protein